MNDTCTFFPRVRARLGPGAVSGAAALRPPAGRRLPLPSAGARSARGARARDGGRRARRGSVEGLAVFIWTSRARLHLPHPRASPRGRDHRRDAGCRGRKGRRSRATRTRPTSWAWTPTATTASPWRRRRSARRTSPSRTRPTLSTSSRPLSSHRTLRPRTRASPRAGGSRSRRWSCTRTCTTRRPSI